MNRRALNTTPKGLRIQEDDGIARFAGDEEAPSLPHETYPMMKGQQFSARLGENLPFRKEKVRGVTHQLDINRVESEESE